MEQLFISSVTPSDGQTFLVLHESRLDRLYHPVCDLINSQSHQKLDWNKVTWKFQFLNRFIMRTHGFLTSISQIEKHVEVWVICIFSTSFWGNLYIRPKTGQNRRNRKNLDTKFSKSWLFSICSELFGPWIKHQNSTVLLLYMKNGIVKTFDKPRSLTRGETVFLHRYI